MIDLEALASGQLQLVRIQSQAMESRRVDVRHVMAIFDRVIVLDDGVMALSLSPYPYLAIQFPVWILGAGSGAEFQRRITTRSQRK